jgi:hypothetical protein
MINLAFLTQLQQRLEIPYMSLYHFLDGQYVLTYQTKDCESDEYLSIEADTFENLMAKYEAELIALLTKGATND